MIACLWLRLKRQSGVYRAPSQSVLDNQYFIDEML